ncbi:phenylalanine--tRNA ligase subunit beta [bacterium]|nr:MAG: phenylalanine--tRNA ligase subunit beta [bacterium]
MRVVLSWLKEYVDLDGVAVETLVERWTQAGLEVEGVERIGDWWDRERLLVGAVTAVHPHPNADRLVLADVDYGAGAPHRVVTGAPNLLPLREAGALDRPLKVVFAREGVELFDGHAAGWHKVVLKGRPVRGVMSDAMVCSAKEIGLSDDHEGILILDDGAPVGRPLADVLGDVVVEVAITANMARAMNVVGLARETAAILDRPLRGVDPATGAPLGGAGAEGRGAPRAAGSTPPPAPAATAVVADDAGDLCAVAIEAPDLCPRYTARLVRDVRLGPSPEWLRRRLTLAGMRPIKNVVDVTNYAMLEWGEPLHAFDHDKLVARAGGGVPRIVVRRAAPGERMTTLDGVDRALDGDTLLIADAAGPVAIAGIMGGADTEVDDGTRHVLLEAAAFDFINVRRTSRMLKLTSESAARFGRGVHPALAETGAARAAALLSELAGGRAVGTVADAYPRPPAPVLVTLPLRDIRRTLGVEVPVDAVLGILERLAFDLTHHVDGATGAITAVEAVVPPHRMDVALPVDLIEEVARVYGYDRLPGTRMADPLPPQRDNPTWEVDEAVRDALVAAGLQEAISYRLVAPRAEARLVPGAGDADAGGTPEHVTLRNPISPERAALRRSILTGLLEATAGNLRFRDRVALFELGRVFHPRPGEALPDEPRRLGVVLTGAAEAAGWRTGGGRKLDFYDAKGAVERVLAALEVDAAWSPGRHASFHPGRTAEVRSGDAVLGHVGELHPLVRRQWGLGDDPVAAADLDLDALERAAGRVRPFRPFSVYPAMLRDLAVVVDEAVAAADVEAAIRRAGGALLADVVLFDVYRGAQVGAGKKSLAWSLTLQAPDKTLEGKVADGARARIVKALERELGAAAR